MLIDTHAHIHFEGYEDVEALIQRAADAGVTQIVTVGVSGEDSQKAVSVAQQFDQVYATVGLHPHDAKLEESEFDQIEKLAHEDKVVAIGECGLDYYRNLSESKDQEKAFRRQIELAEELKLPLVFHVREAYTDFLRIIKDYQGVRGIVHSFTGNRQELDQILEQNFLVALNGIATFSKDSAQQEVFKAIPLANLVLETDCPFLTPAPHRGQQNEPANMKLIADFVSELRGESLDQLAEATTKNAQQFFGLPAV